MVVPTEQLEQELQQLTVRHAQLREDLEGLLRCVRELEERFISMRPTPPADDATKAELKRKMVLVRPWRDELNQIYRTIIANSAELEQVTRRIQAIQTTFATSLSRKG